MQTPPSTPRKLECPWAPKPERRINNIDIHSFDFFNTFPMMDFIEQINENEYVYSTPKNKNKNKYFESPVYLDNLKKKRKVENLNIEYPSDTLFFEDI